MDSARISPVAGASRWSSSDGRFVNHGASCSPTTEEQLSDRQVADLYAFVRTQPPVPEAGGSGAGSPAPEGAPLGQRLYMQTVGCGQCHEPENGFGRMWLGEHAEEVDFEYFATQIYEHTDKYPRGSMGNYSRTRLPESVLREIYQWMVLDIGLRASVGANMRVGDRRGDQTTFDVEVTNRGVKDVGLDVEGITLFIRVPDDATVVGGTGQDTPVSNRWRNWGSSRGCATPHTPTMNPDVIERPEQDLSGDVVVWKMSGLAARGAANGVVRVVGS